MGERVTLRGVRVGRIPRWGSGVVELLDVQEAIGWDLAVGDALWVPKRRGRAAVPSVSGLR